MFRWTGLFLYFPKSPKIRVTHPNCCGHHNMDSCSLLQAWQGCFLEIRKVAESHRQGTAHRGIIFGVPGILRSSSVGTMCSRGRTQHPAAAPLQTKPLSSFSFGFPAIYGKWNNTSSMSLPGQTAHFPCSPELVGFEEPCCCSKSFLSTAGPVLTSPWPRTGDSGTICVTGIQGAGSIWDTSYTLQTRNKLTWAGSSWGAH